MVADVTYNRVRFNQVARVPLKIEGCNSGLVQALQLPKQGNHPRDKSLEG